MIKIPKFELTINEKYYIIVNNKIIPHFLKEYDETKTFYIFRNIGAPYALFDAIVTNTALNINNFMVAPEEYKHILYYNKLEILNKKFVETENENKRRLKWIKKINQYFNKYYSELLI